ncbi:unnamed protein product [Ectocarpus sp. 8 AP-2014]
MDNAVKMLMAKTGRGFRLKRENKTKLWTKKNEEEDSRRRNRWSCVSIKCYHGRKPRKRPRVEGASARRNSKSRKVGCNFHLGLVGEQQCYTASKPLPRAPHPDFRRKGARAPTSFRQRQRRERRGHRGGVRPYPSAALFQGHNERDTQGFGGHRKEAGAGRKAKGAKHEARVRRRADR